SVTISYGGDLKRYMKEHDLPWIATGGEVVAGGFDSTTIQNKILTNPWYYIANSRHMPYLKDSDQFQTYDAGPHDMPKTDTRRPADRKLSPCDVAISLKGYTKPAGGVTEPNIMLGIFALMSGSSEWERVLNEDDSRIFNAITGTKSSGSTQWTVDEGNSGSTRSGNSESEALEHQFTLKFIFRSVTPTSNYVKEMRNWYDDYYQDTSKIPVTKMDSTFTVDTYKELLTTSTIDTKPKRALRLMMTDGSQGFNSLYFQGHLRVDTVSKMKAKDFGAMIGNHIDTDYDVKEASFFEKAIAIVIVVVAIVVGFLIGGPIGGWKGAAAGLAATSTVLMIGMMAMSAFGGMRIQGVVDKVGAFAQIVGYAAMVTGVMAIYESAKQAAMEAARDQLVLEQGMSAAQAQVADIALSVMDVLKHAVNTAVDSALSSVGQVFSAVSGEGTSFTATQITSAAMDGLQIAQKGFELYTSREDDKFAEEYDEKNSELAKLSKELDGQRRVADPLYTLTNATENVTSYDSLSHMEIEWKTKHSPQGFFDEFHSERTIA
ncbi:MAG: hypothetical protein DRI65_11065, partial [Chloroflexota bacterium]